jgi:GTP cyclohydrolase I
VQKVFGYAGGSKMGYERLENEIRKLLKEIGITKEEVLQNTPKRWIELIKDFNVKKYEDFKTFYVGDYNQMVVYECKFYSLCEHHLLPFFGKVFIGYLPVTHVIGISKISKLVSTLAKKPTIQEELTEEICKSLRKNIPGVIGVAVVIHGYHTCVSIRYGDGWLTTSSLHGIFKHNPFAKQEFLDFVKHRITKEVF